MSIKLAMKNIKLSVLVISYNQQEYIRQTVESIAKQLDPQQCELIVADDCSTDNTQNIIFQLANEYPVIKPIFNKTNLGVIKNYFNGISKCSGEYIMDCGGDDFFLDNKVNIQLEFMKKHPNVAVSCTKMTLINKNGEKIGTDSATKSVRYFTFYDLLVSNKIGSSSMCIKKSVMDAYMLEVNPLDKNWLMEDYPLWLWVSKKYKIALIPEELVCYRVMEGTVSRQNSLIKKIDFENSVLDIKKYFMQSSDEEIVMKIYRNNIARLYLAYGNTIQFRNTLAKNKDFISYFWVLVSYIPKFALFYKIAKQTKDRIKKIISMI